jgi:chromosome segregation ATPase
VLKLPEEIYEELEKRAKIEGFALVSDYIRELISRELGRAPVDLRTIQERIDKLESGSLPPRLYDVIWNIAEEILSSKLPDMLSDVELSESNVDITKLERRIERKMQDMFNPWTQKIDELARKLGELTEEVDKLKEEIDSIKDKLEKEREQKSVYPESRVVAERFEHKAEHARRFTAMDRLRQQGAVFEDELRTIRAKDFFFRKLERSGAKIVVTQRHGRVAVHPDAWEEFLKILEESKSGDEEEVLEKLDKDALKKLFLALRQDGSLIFDSGSREWKLTVS